MSGVQSKGITHPILKHCLFVAFIVRIKPNKLNCKTTLKSCGVFRLKRATSFLKSRSIKLEISFHLGSALHCPKAFYIRLLTYVKSLTCNQSPGNKMARIVKEPEERKNELIDIAEQLFIAHGYEQTAISDIVREASVSQGAFYYYFESKEDVLVAVIEKKIALMENDFLLIADRSDLDEAAKINSMINSFICISASAKAILGYIHQARNAALHKKLMKARPFARIAPIMARVIFLGCEKGRFNVLRPLETSYLLLMMVGSAYHMFYQNEAFRESNDIDRKNREFQESMRSAMEDLIGRTLGVNDYKFEIMEI
jgi:AcrR family transcriptional regulator